MYGDLLEIDEEALNKAIEAASQICCDAVNLSFTQSSSTSGMNPKWTVSISMSCTIHFGPKGFPPSGMGEHFNDALRSFTKNINDYYQEMQNAQLV